MLRRPAFAGVIALALGLALGPLGLHVLRPQLLGDGASVESLSEGVLLLCLFCIGLRLRTPFEWQFWRVAVRLSTLTMLATVALVAAAAHLMFDMTLPQSLLLGAVLAPTDPAPLGEAPSHAEIDPEAASVVLATEAGLNSGLATVLVLVALRMIGLSDADSAIQGVTVLSAAWSAVGGVCMGGLIGVGTASWIRTLDPARQTDFLEETTVFATAAVAYGAAIGSHTNEFLSVFAAAVALCHGGRLRRPTRNRPLMPRVLKSAMRIERAGWLVATVLLGALLAQVEIRPMILILAALLVPIRVLAVRLGLGGLVMPESQWRRVAWFTARGTASLYCLAFAINHGLDPRYARELASITLIVLAISVISSVVSAPPLRRPAPRTLDL